MTPSDKLLNSIVASSIVIFTMSYPVKILVSGEISGSLLWVGLILSIPITILALIRLFDEKSSARKYFTEKSSVWFGVLVFIIGIPMVTTMAVYKSIPVLGHLLSSTPAKIEVTVERKRSRFHSRGFFVCEGIFYAEELHRPFGNRICGLNERDWHALKVGDKVVLTGSMSEFGFIYNGYEIQDVK